MKKTILSATLLATMATTAMADQFKEIDLKVKDLIGNGYQLQHVSTGENVHVTYWMKMDEHHNGTNHAHAHSHEELLNSLQIIRCTEPLSENKDSISTKSRCENMREQSQ